MLPVCRCRTGRTLRSGLPAIVYMSPAVIDMPHCDPLLPAISSIRFPAVSLMYTLPLFRIDISG
jgi:hypothetical protein